jgi:hypothetical protein
MTEEVKERANKVSEEGLIMNKRVRDHLSKDILTLRFNGKTGS